MTDYTKFDALLIATIRNARANTGSADFSDIAYHAPLMALATSLARPDSRGFHLGRLVTDRRLQALRKAGKLTYDRKTGWRAA